MAQTLLPDYPSEGSDLAAAIRRRDVIREPHPDLPSPFIHDDDLAAVAQTVLSPTRTLIGWYAPGAHQPACATSSRQSGTALGRAVPFRELSPQQAAERARRRGVAEDQIAQWLAAETSRT